MIGAEQFVHVGMLVTGIGDEAPFCLDVLDKSIVGVERGVERQQWIKAAQTPSLDEIIGGRWKIAIDAAGVASDLIAQPHHPVGHVLDIGQDGIGVDQIVQPFAKRKRHPCQSA